MNAKTKKTVSLFLIAAVCVMLMSQCTGQI